MTREIWPIIFKKVDSRQSGPKLSSETKTSDDNFSILFIWYHDKKIKTKKMLK